jgi:signal transduction histidine kinase
MKPPTPSSPWQRWLNSTRPRIFIWYFLLTAGSSVASILLMHHILYGRIRDQAQDYVLRQVREFQQMLQQSSTADTSSHQRIKTIFDSFFSRYEPIDGDDYAIALLHGQAYRYSSSFPQQLLTQDAALIQQWGKLTRSRRGRVDTSLGELFYIAEPVVIDGTLQGVLVIVHCSDSVYQIVDSAVLLIIPATLGVMTIAAVIAWATAGRVLEPLRGLMKTAQSITETDMTQRILVEGTDEIAELTRTFNEMLDRLQVAFTSQQEFLKDAGHELRTPITVVRGYLETFKYQVADRQEQIMLLAIDELDRMGRLVNDLLLLARAESPDFLTVQPEELDWLTEELYLKVRSMADRHWKLESKGLSPVRVDRHRITQAVMNLVQNAIRHTTKGDAIAIGSTILNNQAHIWVRDTGRGIAVTDQARIFERFARATSVELTNVELTNVESTSVESITVGVEQVSQTERDGLGLGLGLAIVEAIAQAHGGKVELVSVPGQGATFTIVIPLEIVSDEIHYDSDLDHRRQSSHHRLSRIRSTRQWLPDHRR